MLISTTALAERLIRAGNSNEFNVDRGDIARSSLEAEADTFDEYYVIDDARPLAHFYKAADSSPMNGWTKLGETEKFLSRYDYNNSGKLGGGEIADLKEDYAGLFRALHDVEEFKRNLESE